MRLFAMLLTVALAACAATPKANPEQLSATPAGIELASWCDYSDPAKCRQGAADVAQRHCALTGKNARYIRSTLMERDLALGERWHFVFDCVR